MGAQLKSALTKSGFKSEKDASATLEEPPDPKLGDLASTMCFDLARSIHKAPSWICSEVSQKVKPAGLVEKVEVAGNYINFFVNFPKLAEMTLDAIETEDDGYGRQKAKEGKVVIEHTSVNPTKPLHIGHGRNAVLGDTTCRILRALGHEVEVHNYVDDMGRQMAETLLAYRKVKQKPKAKFDHLLGLIYSDMHKRIGIEAELEKEVKDILAELEEGKGKTAGEAKKLAERCVEENLKTSDRLGIGYDLLVWESDLVRAGLLKEALDTLRKTGHLVGGAGERAGAMILKLSDQGMDDKVLVRSDGTAVYTARDIAYQLWKFGKAKTKLKFKINSKRPDGTKTYETAKLGKTSARFGRARKVINVVGAEQKFPQRVVFTALKILGHESEYENSHHLAYEHVWLPSGKFSGRKGTWVGFSVDEVIEEAVARAYEIVKEHARDETQDFWNKSAELVGVGAVRYSLLGTTPEKKIVFKWEEALNFERNSGPAVQYSHARASSILRKARGKGGKRPAGLFTAPQERRLITLLAKFPQVVQNAGERLQPHLVAQSASEIAVAFNTFYEACPVIEAETRELRAARLRLVNCVRIVLRNALGLMGMAAPERM